MPWDTIFVVNRYFAPVHRYLTFDHQTLIEKFLADFDFLFSSKVRFQKLHRDHDRDRKFIPDRSNLDFYFSTKPRLKIFRYSLAEKLRLAVNENNNRFLFTGHSAEPHADTNQNDFTLPKTSRERFTFQFGAENMRHSNALSC